MDFLKLSHFSLWALIFANHSVLAETINEYSLPIAFTDVEMITVKPDDQFSPTRYTLRVFAETNLTGQPDLEMDVQVAGEIVDIDFIDVDDDEVEEFVVKSELPNGGGDYHLDVFEL